MTRTGTWPRLLDLPTGSGKTATIDVAVYHLAHAAGRGRSKELARRIWLVADRRALVDQAWLRGHELLDRIEHKSELAAVREALGKLSDEPARSVRLRGACPTDRHWYGSADQVLIVATTVDQLGSRLLMRGYGTSPKMRPVEAGLAGCDSLLLIDEAHLAQPLLDTLCNVESAEPVRQLGNGFRTVLLTATPGSATRGGELVTLQDDDRADPELGRRLRAVRTIEWQETEEPVQLAADVQEPCLLMIANTVETARRWYRRIVWPRNPARVPEEKRFLITGRMRPIERSAVVTEVADRLAQRLPTTVVATQCVEAGLDWDFDALISECASWDALTQRIGRVNRGGLRPDGHCWIVQATRRVRQRGRESKETEPACPVYGEHERAVADWLKGIGRAKWTPDTVPRFNDGRVRSPENAPLLIPEYLTLWSQTRADGPAYDVSAFLHGNNAETDVQVIWRDSRNDDESMILLEHLPPSSLEAVQVPISRAKRWLGERTAVRVGAKLEHVTADTLQPSDTIVVRPDYGGLPPEGTFDEEWTSSPARDVSAAALREHREIEYLLADEPEDLDSDEPIRRQVATWIGKEAKRAHLRAWQWIDTGKRWLFVSRRVRTDDDAGTSQRRTLETHLRETITRARTAGERLLPERLEASIVCTAEHHDIGKLDVRFQRMLGRKLDEDVLAHSGNSGNRSTRTHDYPREERHEALSVELVRRLKLHEGLDSNEERELVEHLIASHHGWARPFIWPARGAAVLSDAAYGLGAEPITHNEETRSPQRFTKLQERYGWLGLAWLEAVFRLADQAATTRGGGDTPMVGKTPPWTAEPERRTGEGRERPSTRRVVLPTLHGIVPGDYLAGLGVLHALYADGKTAQLWWEGMTPWLRTMATEDEIVESIERVRSRFAVEWPEEREEEDHRIGEMLKNGVRGPAFSLLKAMRSVGTRSPMDFISEGRGSFSKLCTGLTDVRDRQAARLLTREALRETLFGHRTLHRHIGQRNVVSSSFRWNALAMQSARRPKSETDDVRTEPWIECLAMMGVAALTAVPVSGWSALRTASSGMRNWRQFVWPLWETPLGWNEVAHAIAGTTNSVPAARWYSAERISGRQTSPRTYQFAAAKPLEVSRRRQPRQHASAQVTQGRGEPR